MISLTFGEQVKIVLSRKDMTIKELAEEIEARTGKKMSRQNLTQRLGRDNFQEQDMRMIADILGCPFQLSILGNADSEKEALDEEEMPTGRELEKLTAKKERRASVFSSIVLHERIQPNFIMAGIGKDRLHSENEANCSSFLFLASHSSYLRCKFIQIRAGIFVTFSKATDISGVIELLPFITAMIVFSGFDVRMANSLMLIPISFSFSANVSPGWETVCG